MNKSVKRISCLLLSLGMGFAVACGNGGGGEGGAPSGALKGTITIALPLTTQEEQVMNAVANAYMDYNPFVTVSVDVKGAADYKDWLSQTLTETDMNKVTMDIVKNNEVSQYYGSNKFVDFSQYLGETNNYYDGQIWEETMDGAAYTANGANGQVYSLNFETTQVLIYYNKDLLTEAGVTAEEITDWDKFVEACEKIAALGDAYTPIAISGDRLSFWSGQLSWLFRVYVDQYFRSVTDAVHTRQGDWNFDPLKDADWEYKPNASDWVDVYSDPEEAFYAAANNDRNGYNKNELRLLEGVMTDKWGQNDPRYKDMLTNFLRVFPQYVGSGFGADTQDTAMTPFWNGTAGFTIMTTDLLNEWQKRESTNFELGVMDFFPMLDNTTYAGGTPDINYTRSIGGAHGYYGVVNKNAEQTKLCMDFIKFWTSKEGQEVAFAKRKELNFLLTGKPLINGLDIPAEINLLGDVKLRGIADSNPATYFARGLGNEGNSTRAFQENTQQLFAGTIDVETYGANMSKAHKDYMSFYLESRGFRANALDDVTRYPF